MPLTFHPTQTTPPGDTLPAGPVRAGADDAGYLLGPSPHFAPPVADTLREASAAEVFGAASQPGPCHTGTALQAPGAGNDAYPFSGTVVFQWSVLLLLAGYCFILYRYRSSVAALAKMLRSKIYTDKLLDDANYTFLLFIDLTAWLGLLASGIGILRFAEVAGLVPEWDERAAWAFEAALPVLIAALAVIMGYRLLVVRLAGALTLDGEFCDRLWYLRKMATALGTIVVTPALLLLALNTSGTQIAIATLVFALWFLATGFVHYKTYTLFVGQNFSILHWFLYLCAVEIFPISLIIALILRINWQ